jgi:hypothetical protein
MESPFEDQVVSGVSPVLHLVKDAREVPAKSNAILKSKRP